MLNIDIINFLELDNFINSNYNNFTIDEYEKYVQQLEELKEKILGE